MATCTKQAYPTKHKAEAAVLYFRELGRELGAYTCEHCGNWHVGHTEEKGRGYDGAMENAIPHAPKVSNKQKRAAGKKRTANVPKFRKYAQPEINDKLPSMKVLPTPRLMTVSLGELLGEALAGIESEQD